MLIAKFLLFLRLFYLILPAPSTKVFSAVLYLTYSILFSIYVTN